MATPLLTIDADPSQVIAALDALGEFVQQYTREAAFETGHAIATEARNRVRRATGKTAAGITMQADRSGMGVVVQSSRHPTPNVPVWLESGTKHSRAFPYFFAAARLEAGNHDRRLRDAVDRAISDAGGLG